MSSKIPVNVPQMREECCRLLSEALPSATQFSAFVGLDGFVDEIIHIVDKRDDHKSFTRVPTISAFAARVAGAASKSTNMELVNVLTKLGGNGPIMANALASYGLKVTYVGNLGFPTLHPVFQPFADRAEVISIAEACHTDALEFEDGKLLMGKLTPMDDVTWENIQTRVGKDRFLSRLSGAQLIGFVNWTMVTYMSDIWRALLKEICPLLQGPKRWMFVDLADPEKRSLEDIGEALDLIVEFQKHFEVILGLNEKEATEIAKVLRLPQPDRTPESLAELALEIYRRVPVNTLAIHPVTYALAVSDGKVDAVSGPYVPKPLITTGAGDHFNAGFCIGKLLGLSNQLSLLSGVTSSGFYVRTANSPRIEDLIQMMQNWPA